MWQFLNKLYLKNIFTLLSGSVLAQIFTFSIYPILTYLYTPDEFGIYGLFSATLLAVAAISNGGYHTTILLPETRLVAYNLFALCGILVCAVSAVGLLAVVLINFVTYYNISQTYGGWFLVLPISIFFEGSYFALSALLNREGKYSTLTRAKIIQALSTGIFSIIIGYWLPHSGGLIIGMVLGQLFSFVVIFVEVKSIISLKDISLRQIKRVAIEYKDFPKYGLGSSYLNTLSRQLPFFLIPLYFGAEVLGNFTLAHKILTAPITFIASSVSMIYYEKVARFSSENSGLIVKLNDGISKMFVLFCFVPLFITLFWGPEVFNFLFGLGYVDSGVYARWIFPWIIMMYILNPLSLLVNIYNKLRPYLVYNSLLFIVRIIILVFGGLFLNPEETIAIYGLTGFLFSIALYLYLIKLPTQRVSNE